MTLVPFPTPPAAGNGVGGPTAAGNGVGGPTAAGGGGGGYTPPLPAELSPVHFDPDEFKAPVSFRAPLALHHAAQRIQAALSDTFATTNDVFRTACAWYTSLMLDYLTTRDPVVEGWRAHANAYFRARWLARQRGEAREAHLYNYTVLLDHLAEGDVEHAALALVDHWRGVAQQTDAYARGFWFDGFRLPGIRRTLARCLARQGYPLPPDLVAFVTS